MYNIEDLQTLEYHQSMVLDTTRTKMFLRAIMRTVKKGDVVLDLGCGTGIMSYFACIAGAKQVYAVEQGPVIELAERICQHNGFQDRVTFIHDWSSNVDLPEKVDVIVTETIGNMGFDEGIVGWVMDARKRLLSEDGRIIPGTIELIVAPVESLADYSRLDSWLGDLYSLDFSVARLINANNLHWTQLSKKMFIAEPTCMAKLTLSKISSSNLFAKRSFICKRDGRIHGLGGWFSAELTPGISINNAPPIKANSWNHGFLPLERPLSVKAGDRLHVRIEAENNGAHWKWGVHLEGSGDNHRASMNDNDHPLQSTTLGYLLDSTNSRHWNHKPQRNQYGESDLLILHLMDGNHSIKEIASKVMDKFPAQYADRKSAVHHVNAIVRDYSRWETML